MQVYPDKPPPQTVSAKHAKYPAIVLKLSTLLHVSIVLIALSIAFVLFDNSLFAWHPVFMSIGYLLFMTEGVLSAVLFRKIDGPDRVRAIQSHALLQLRAVLCIAVGFGVIYRNKILLGKLHFQTTHAKFGLATLILSALSPLVGIVSFRKMGIIQKFPERWQPWIKAVHRQAGIVAWLLSLATIELALTHKAVYKEWLTPVWQAGVAFIGMLMLGIMLKAVAKAKDPEDALDKAV